MAVICEDCDRTFGTRRALEQHRRDSPVHAVPFGTEQALQQHLQHSPNHTVTFDCDKCGRRFNREQALQQHLRDLPIHAVTFDCNKCDRNFTSEQALQQHLQDSPVHMVTFECDECDRSFDTKQALQQHLRDSPVHKITFACEQCDRSFDTEQALQQHLRDSPAHVSFSVAVVTHSFNLQPALDDEVLQLLRAYDLTFDFFAADDPHGVLKEHHTSVMGTFTCTNRSCPKNRWTSKQIAITIRQYPGRRYNARVYFKRCESCDSLSQPELDSSYAERVSYRLAKWSGIAVEPPPDSGRSRRPHQSNLCEGCPLGYCQQSRL